MLQLYKNQAVTNVSKEQIDIRELELNWYCSNYDTLAVSGTMMAGFAYDQITEPIPDDCDILNEVIYVVLTAVSLGLALSVAVTCIFAVIFGKSLALRGTHGSRSVHLAVDNLRAEQKIVFMQFVGSLLCYLVSHVFEIWIFNGPITATIVSAPMLLFFLLIIYYVISLTAKLQVRDMHAISGAIPGLAAYERVPDLDKVNVHYEDRTFSPSRTTGRYGKQVGSPHRQAMDEQTKKLVDDAKNGQMDDVNANFFDPMGGDMNESIFSGWF